MEYLAVNPDRREQDAGRQQSVLSIRGLISHMSDALCMQLQAPASAPVEELVRIDIYSCQSCGRFVRQRPEDRVPQCCNRDMEFAAPDSASV